jgi:hypothetical protein
MNRLTNATLPLLLIAVLGLSANVFAAGAKAGGGGMRGGGGKGGLNNGRNNNNNNKENDSEFKWFSSQSDATTSAKSADAPVMVVLRRPGNPDDTKMIDKMASWPMAQELSQESFSAMRLSADSPEGKSLLARLKIKTLPAIAWLDQYGNAILGQAMPDNVQPISAVIQNWKNTLAGIEKFFKDHQARGEKYLNQSRLREAYQEFSIAAPFKGPLPEAAKAALDKVKERWTQLLDLAAAMPAESVSRAAIFKGLRRDTQGLDFGAVLELAIQNGGTGKQVAAADKPGPAEEKSLSEVVSSRVSISERDNDDGALDYRCLEGKADERYKQVEQMLKDAVVEYKKATAESMERGPARNELLKSAHAKFEKSLTLLETASAGKPAGDVEKLMEKTSMLMYGTLKYQTL